MLTLLPMNKACGQKIQKRSGFGGGNSLITALTGWRPSYDIETGLRETIDWFCKPEKLKKYKANIYNV